MFRVPSISGLFKWRQFEPEVILLAVGWYLRFSLSYRDVEELLAERGLHADHVTVWRWVQRYSPEMERRLRSRLKPTQWRYLYRAVDSTAATLDFPSPGQAGPSDAASHQHRQAYRLPRAMCAKLPRMSGNA